MFSGAPIRVARLALIVGLVGLAVGAFVVFPLSLLSLHAEASVSSFEEQYEKRGGDREPPLEEPTPGASPTASPSPSPTKPRPNDRALAWKAAKITARSLSPVFWFVGAAAVLVGASSVRKLVQK